MRVNFVFLIENRGRLIEKKELLDAVWEDAFVTENIMTQVIAQLRQALGDAMTRGISRRYARLSVHRRS